ncbi:hypothetical protein FORC065_2480 [Yersinia enterocolitica]|nr:hypothetical protein FORC065_2480 [Yersinia enterocolitica]
MSYHPERQRPEQQFRNANREALNIQQPGEHTHHGFDWEAVKAARKAAGRPLTVSQTTDPSINLKDMALSAVAVPADMVSAGAQWFKAGNQLLDSKAEEYSSGEKKPLIDIPVDPELLRVMRENAGNPVSRTGSALIEKAGALAEHFSHDVKANYSEGAKQAAAMKFVERDAQGNLKIGAGAFDKDAWLINAIPALTQLATGGYAAKLGAKAVAQGIERSVYEKLKKSVPDTVARETAQMAAEKARAIARKSGFVGITAGTAQGQGGMEMRDEINALPFTQLIESPTFQRLFEVIDKAPENVTLSDTQKLTLARQQLAEVAASSVTADPRLLAINIAASTLGDHTLLKLLTGKTTARGIVPGMVRGTLAEGTTEYAQGASQRYAQNQQLIDTAGQKIDPIKDVVETGANNAMLGAGIGGTIGAVGGSRGRHAASDVTPETPPEVAGTPIAEESPPQSPIMADPQVNDPAMADVVAQPRSVEEHGIPNHRIDEFRDTPAYRRQDPRVQGFTDDSEVQRALAEPSSPTAQALIEQQMASGEQGLSPDELAIYQQAEHVRTQRTPRLPEPGNIHPGEGFPMSGPVLEDEAQAGNQPQFTAGEQIRGPVFLPKDTRAEQQGAVREVHTYDGETDPRAITDKNIIFSHGPGVNSDDVQSGQAPQFEGGQRKDVRRFTEAMAGSPKTVITDQRQRAGGVPIDARTEAYAKGEVSTGKPSSREKLTKYSKRVKIDKGNVISDTGHTRNGIPPVKGMRQREAQGIANMWVRGMKGAARIQVKVVQTQAEAADMMPSGIPDEFGTVHALYQPEFSRVIVVADNIADGRQLRAKLRHEVLAHHGLASVIGDVEYDRILRVLHQTRGSKNKTIQSVWREVDRSYSNETPEMQANEFLAHMAERSELTGFGAMWDRVVSLLINGLKKAGILKPGDITPTEIRTILRTIAGRFKKTAMYDDEKPGTKEFENTFSRTDALYSKERHDPFKPDSYDARQFATEVESIASMEQVPRHQIRLGDTPAVYQALGARNIELIMPASVVHKATDPAIRDHAVRLEDVKKLPALLSDPLAVMRSATEHGALVSLIAAQDVNGHPVITAIHLNVKGASFAEVNKISSIYGQDNRVALQKQLDNDLLYIDKEKATKWLHAAGLQLPGANTVSGSNKNILSRLDVRNNKALYSRTTNPSMEAETNRKMGLHVEQGWIDKAKSFYENVASKDKTALKVWLSDTGRKLNTQTFDGLAPIKYAEDSAGISDARSSAYIGARMAAGAGSVITAALELGLPRYNKAEGIIEQQAGTHQSDALIGILDELGNHREHFFKWIAGHRSERLMKEGKEHNFTADEITYMKTLNRGHEPLFDRQKKKYDAFIRSMLDLQQDMGLIDPDSRKQWEHAWYLPYFRETEGGEVVGPWNSKGIANQRSTVRRLKGSELTIKDPIENLFNYVAKSIDASMKNEAMRRAVINLADTGVVEVIESPNMLDYQRLGKDVVKVFIDGQQELVKVNDPALYRAFTMIDLQRSNALFMKAARQAKKVLTVCTTSMPDFIIRNFLRDSVHAWAINKDGFTPVVDSWKSLRKALRTDTSLTEMMFAGATFGGGYSNAYDPVSSAKTIRGVLRRKGYSDSQIREFESSIVRNSKEVMGKIRQGLHQYQRLSEAAENANRLATYEAALKAGKSKAQAAFESRDLMDFSMMGSSTLMITLSDMLPFFNARMQGVSKLGRALKNDPMGVLKRGGLITAASLGLMALNWDDERYEELPDWDKDIYWHAWVFGQHIRFPKPFELGLLLGTLPERFIRMLVGKDSGAKFGKLVAHNFMETMAFNPIPQVVRPIAEAYVNYDFFKGGPIENLADSHLVAGARYNNQTSLLMREIGEATNLSPKMLDHLVMAYTGTLGSYVMGATNLLMRNIQDHGDTPTLRLDEMPVIKSFFRGSEPAKSTQFTEDFYRMMAEANQINSTINSFYKQGRGDDAGKLREKHQGKLLQRKGLTTTQKQIKALNAQIEMVRRDRILTAEQKRERIDRLMATRNKLVRQTVERVNPYFM